MSEHLTLLRAWLASPLKVAALTPSSRSFAALVASGVDPDAGPVIELGAGTGPVTQALLDRGVPEHRLVLVESDPTLADALRRRFPRVRTLGIDAARIGTVDLFGGEKAAAVVSGVPVLTMPRATIAAILSASFSQLRTDGTFYQYSYALRCPVPRDMLAAQGLTSRRVGVTLGNVPPGLVYGISRACAAVVTA